MRVNYDQNADPFGSEKHCRICDGDLVQDPWTKEWYCPKTPHESEDKPTKEELFNAHESLMVTLCKILELDYLEATEQDVVEAVRKMAEKTPCILRRLTNDLKNSYRKNRQRHSLHRVIYNSV